MGYNHQSNYSPNRHKERKIAPDTRSSETVRCGEIVLHPDRQEVTVGGHAHHLTPLECRLLGTLLKHPGKILSYTFLMLEVWDTNYVDDLGTLRVHISWIRKKIATGQGGAWRIENIRGVGYALTRD